MDEMDQATETAEKHLAAAIQAAARPVPPGMPGECWRCGEDSPRLVHGACAPCRDKYRLR